MKIIKDVSPNTYMALIKFKTQVSVCLFVRRQCTM